MTIDRSGVVEPTAASGVAKAGAIWMGVALGKAGVQTWSDLAAMLAAVYSAILIVAWVWRAVRRWRKGRTIVPDTDRGGL